MLAWLFPSPAERRLLGGGRLRGPTPWVIAIMSFSIMMIAASGLALANTASLLGNAIAARYSVEVPGGGGDLGSLVQTIERTPGVMNVDAVPESEMRRILQRWLGPSAQSADLPVPALINFDLRPGGDLRRIQQQVSAAAPGAQIAAHSDAVRPLVNSLRLLQWVALGLVLLLSAAAAAAVILAARSALDANRATIEVMHGVGATDIQVTQLFQRRIALDALIGSLVGASAAAVVLILLAAGAAFAGELTGGATLQTLDLIILALVPAALTALATGVARTAVLAALRENL
jgi:cell division transport system permease protein